MENQQADPKLLQTTSQKPSPIKSSGDLLHGDPAGLVDRLKGSPSKREIPRVAEISQEAQVLMTGVFTRMATIYGHLWSSMYKDRDILNLAQAEWCAGFHARGLTSGDVGLTLDHCRDQVVKMPNLPQFLELADSVRSRRLAARRSQHLGLPRIETDEEKAARALEKAQEAERRKAIAAEYLPDLIAGMANRPVP